MSCILVPSSAAAASGVKSAVYPACDDHETPQLLDQRTQTLMRVSDVPKGMSMCFFSPEADAVAAVAGGEQTRS